MYETEQTTHTEQNVIADEHLPTKGGETPLNGYKKKRRAIIEIDGIKHHILLSKIVLLCGDCNKPIKNANSLNKKFCDDCIKKHRYEKSRRWLKNHPRKNAIYQKDKNIIKM